MNLCGLSEPIPEDTWCIQAWWPIGLDHKHFQGTHAELLEHTRYYFHVENCNSVTLWYGNLPVYAIGDLTDPNNNWVLRREELWSEGA